MKRRSVPALDVLAAHEQAALKVRELRRKGVHCHLEEHADACGCQVEVVPDFARPRESRAESAGLQGSSR